VRKTSTNRGTPLGACVEAAGNNANAGLLLFFLLAYVYDGGPTFGTRRDWGDELGMSVKQVADALNVLRSRKVVETRRAWEDGVHGLKVSVLSLPGRPVTRELTVDDDLKETTVTERPKRGPRRRRDVRTVAEATEVVSPLPPEFWNPMTSDDLWTPWRAGAVANDPGRFVSPWDPKDRGHAKILLSKVPHDILGPAFYDAVSRWEEFGEFVTVATTLYKFPTMPSMWVLMKYADQVVEFHRSAGVTLSSGLVELGLGGDRDRRS